MIIRYRTTLQDYADRRKKLHKHDDGLHDTVEALMQGLVVVCFALLVLWLALGAA